MMGRLTEKELSGNWKLKGVEWDQLHAGFVITEEVCRKLYGALYKLKDYEDTGLSPADVERVNDFSQSQAHELLGKLQEERSKHSWVPVAEQLPEPEELVLLSFENFSIPMIGRYTASTDDGGTFRGGDDDESFIEHDLYVNAWMPLPEPYRKERT